ncbi:MAG: patatin-like phospholipase family protein [Acidobacteriota bacterium]
MWRLLKRSEPPEIERVLNDEAARIQSRRGAARQEPGDPRKDAVGLSLSGGGIRSATFNLGVLQALSRYGLLDRIDYLSTVSGGGYIGSALTWFMSYLKQAFPFGTTRKSNLEQPGKIVAWLRAHDRYLAPGAGLNLWSLAAAFFAGLLVNLVILVPWAFLGLYLFTRKWFWTAPIYLKIHLERVPDNDLFAWLLCLGLAFLAALLIASVVSRLAFLRGFKPERAFSVEMGALLMFAALWVLVGTIPVVYNLTAAWFASTASSISLSGLVTLAGACLKIRGSRKTARWHGPVLSIGLALLIYGLVLWGYRFAVRWSRIPLWLWVALLLSVILAAAVNINYLSMHRFYRNRLMEAYLPYKKAGVGVERADRCLLSSIGQTRAPYHLINTNVQLVGSTRPKLRERGGESFILSPAYCGSENTGFVPTDKFAGGRMNLATAFAISGAAVDPNTYATRSRPLTILMTLLNIRLGYWVLNPATKVRLGNYVPQPLAYWYLAREMFGKGLNENALYLHLSDGGHFENLGFYELVRRKCRVIVISDSGADPDYRFNDLARAIERVRVDFGAQVKLNVDDLRPDDKDMSQAPYVTGTVSYDNGQPGTLIYLKPTIFKGLPQDIYSYNAGDRSFPNQSTANQFFDEQQFEAYRELGYQTIARAYKEKAFSAVDPSLSPPAATSKTDLRNEAGSR